MKILKKIYKKALFIIVGIYVVGIFISQQKTLNIYNKDVANYTEEKQLAEETREDLVSMKENVDSPEYIEQIAREKLNMYLPNERVYIGK